MTYRFFDRRSQRAFLCAAVLVLVAACAPTRSQFVGDIPADAPRYEMTLPDPENTILVIWNHGHDRRYEEQSERDCGTVPEALTALAKARIQGMRVSIYQLCSLEAADYDYIRKTGERKLDKRVTAIEDHIFRARRQGVPARRIFLAGQSCGAWASLLVARRGIAEFNGLIGFAPACHGYLKINNPSPLKQAILRNRETDVAYISAIPTIRALIYQFGNDPWAPFGSLDFLDTLDGLERITVNPMMNSYHGYGFTGAFAEEFSDRIRQFVHDSLAAPQS